MRKTFLKIHRIIGLITGIVVFVVAITGCMWVFKEEIENKPPDPVTSFQSDVNIITATEAQAIAKILNPNRVIHGVLFQQEYKVVEVIYYQDAPLFYQSVYLDPNSGQKLGQKDHLSGFFAFALDGHLNVWLPPQIGRWVVKISVLLFLVMVISGIILWWPKNKKALQQRLRFKWKKSTRWKRKNYDLHNILGFYASSLVFVIAFTGCVMAFNWFYYLTYKAWGGNKNPAFEIPIVETIEDPESKTIDLLIPSLKQKHPEVSSFELHYPHDDSSAIYVEMAYDNLHYHNDYKFYNPYTLEEMTVNGIYGSYKDTDIADVLIRMNYDIHIGAIGGVWGKILAFIISLLSASLPLTGFLIWLGRKKKGKTST